MKRLIIDSGVWYAAFDQRDDKYVYSDKILNLLEMHELIVPFPSLYETINTRLLRNKYKQADYLFEYLNDSKKVILVYDDKYREQALKSVSSNLNQNKSYSLVDMIIRLMMEDSSLGSIAVVSFNIEDFIGVNNVEVIDPRQLD